MQIRCKKLRQNAKLPEYKTKSSAGADLYAAAIDQHTAFGVCIRYRPTAVVITGQDRVIAGNGGKVDADITGFAAADDVFPMGQRKF